MKQARNTPQTRAQLNARFKVLCMDAGLNVEAVGKLLHVTPRTVRYWFAGKTAVPYASYKLLRILARYELPGAAWAGWHMHSGRLWSPEGHGFDPHDSNWWGLLVRKAALFTELYDRNRKLENLLLVGGRSDAPAPGTRSRGPSGRVQAVPSGEAGRVPQAPRLDLSNKHFDAQGCGDEIDDGAIMGPWPTTFDYPPNWTLTPAPAATVSASALTPSSASHLMPTLDSQESRDSPVQPLPRLRPKPRRSSGPPQKLRHLGSGKKPVSSAGTGNGKRSNNRLGGAA